MLTTFKRAEQGDRSAEQMQITVMRAELATKIERFTGSDGSHESAIPGLHLARTTRCQMPAHGITQPAVCVMAQGSKRVRLYDEDAMADVRRMVEADPDDISDAMNTLPPDADEPTRQRLAEQLAPTIARHLADYPWISDPAARLSNTEEVTRRTVIQAVTELYNGAQLDVLHRASLLAQEQLRTAQETRDEQ